MVALAAGKTYLTAGGYVVEIINDKLHSSERTAPGITESGRSALEINKDPTNTCKDGWYYEPNGAVNALTEEWTEKLRIVEELPFLIPKLPEGYAWADGYPQFREIKKGEYYVSNHYHENSEYYHKTGAGVYVIENDQSGPSQLSERKFGAKRFAVVRATAMPTPEPKEVVMEKVNAAYPRYYKHRDDGFVDNIKYIERTSENGRNNILKNGETVARNHFSWDSNCDDYVKKGAWVEVPAAEVSAFIASAEEAQMGDWVECINNSDYENKLTVGKKYLIQKPAEIIADEGYYRLIVDGDKWIGGWKMCRFKKVAPPTPVVQEEEKEIVVGKEKDYPLYYRHRDDGFANSIKYLVRVNDYTQNEVIYKNGKSGKLENPAWDKACVRYVESGLWIEVPESEVTDFVASAIKLKKEEEKKIAAAKLNFPLYYRHTAGFVGGTKYVKRISENYFILIQNNGEIRDYKDTWEHNTHDTIVADGTWIEVPAAEVDSFIASKSKEPTDEKVTMKFPIYYNHKHGFNGHTKYVKRINENQYTIILEKDGKEAENEEYRWDKDRDASVAEGIWVEVPAAEVESFIASFKKPEESEQLNFPVYYKNKKGFSSDAKYVKRTSKYYYTINNKGIINPSVRPWTNITDSIVNKEDPSWIEVPEKEVLDFIASVTVTGANSTLVKKEEEIEMKKETAIAAGKTVAKFAGTWGFKAANYWLFEPAANLGRPIVKGVRYAVFLGSLSAAVYGYNNPEMVKNAIKSCIPKITIEAPEVLKG